MQGFSCGLSAHWRLWKLPLSSTRIASPGATSRMTLKPSVSSVTLSEATRNSTPLVGIGAADDERADAVRIAEGEHAVARDHRDHRIGALHAPVHARHRREDDVRIEAVAARRSHR